MHDTFYVEGGTPDEPHLLRTHTSPMQIRYAVQHVKKHRALIERGELMPEIRVIAPGRTYRVDSDATHSPMFHQCEGLWIGENVSFKDLKVVFTDFCRTFFESKDLVLRFRPSFFPFTEPSAELDMLIQLRPDQPPRWIELGGCGMIDPAVFTACGIDPEEWTGFAFGFGIERLAMGKYAIPDIRLLFENDLRFLAKI
jgi:phenylalanyl-tRNA synthetase alpha chain